MALPKLSLQVFEAFEQVARTGSMQLAAREMGLSISSVSHHVARLEEELGVVLLDRSSRPFELTREGREALHHLSAGLQHLRRATSETAVGGLLGTRSLRIGIVEDFESNVAPELAVALAGRMPRARLAISTVLSHEAPARVLGGKLEVAVAAEPQDLPGDIRADPLLRDPLPRRHAARDRGRGGGSVAQPRRPAVPALQRRPPDRPADRRAPVAHTASCCPTALPLTACSRSWR